MCKKITFTCLGIIFGLSMLTNQGAYAGYWDYIRVSAKSESQESTPKRPIAKIETPPLKETESTSELIQIQDQHPKNAETNTFKNWLSAHPSKNFLLGTATGLSLATFAYMAYVASTSLYDSEPPTDTLYDTVSSIWNSSTPHTGTHELHAALEAFKNNTLAPLNTTQCGGAQPEIIRMLGDTLTHAGYNLTALIANTPDSIMQFIRTLTEANHSNPCLSKSEELIREIRELEVPDIFLGNFSFDHFGGHELTLDNCHPGANESLYTCSNLTAKGVGFLSLEAPHAEEQNISSTQEPDGKDPLVKNITCGSTLIHLGASFTRRFERFVTGSVFLRRCIYKSIESIVNCANFSFVKLVTTTPQTTLEKLTCTNLQITGVA